MLLRFLSILSLFAALAGAPQTAAAQEQHHRVRRRLA